MYYNQYYNQGQVNPQGYVQPAPVVNNYPIMGQPANVTQSGVPFQMIRQKLAEFIQAAANNDAPATRLYQEAIGSTGNWMSGKMDSLVQIAAITIDFMYRQNPSQPIPDIVSKAIEEVYCCSWGIMCRLYPQLLNDPTMQGKQQLAKDWQQAADIRFNTFNQLGLLANNQPVNQPAWGTPAFNNGGLPAMGMGNGIPQTQTFNHNGFANGYNRPMGNQPAFYSNNGFSSMGGMSAVNANNGFTYNNQPRNSFSNNWGGNQTNNTTPQLTTDERVAQIAAENQRKREALGPNVQLDKYGNVINDSALNNEPIAYVRRGNMEVPVGINQTPDPKPLLSSDGSGTLTEPKQTLGNGRLFDSSQVTSFAPERYPQVSDNPKSGLTEVNHDIMVNAFANIRNEAIKPAIAIDSEVREQIRKARNEDGLKADEVRYLTFDEVRELHKAKVKFELPYLVPVNANAFTHSIHAVLTKENKVRQEISRLGESMRPEAHDILKPTREDKRVANSINAQRTIINTYTGSSKGGIPYDRFAESKVVLAEGLDKVTSELDDEAKEAAITEAFDKFVDQAKVDIENDYNGVSEHRANNPAENEEDGEFEDAWFTENEKETRKKVNSSILHMEDDPEPEYIDGLNNAIMLTKLDRIEENNVVKNDIVKVRTFCTEGIAHVFNHPKNRNNVNNILQPLFGWKEELTDEDREMLNQLSGEDIAVAFAKTRDAIPDELWVKLNNYATEKVNEGMINIIGLDIEITDFCEDYPQLSKYLAETVDEEEHPNISIAFGYLDAWLLIQLRRFHSLIYNIVKYNDEIDVTELRTVSTVSYNKFVDVPVLPSVYANTTNPSSIIFYNDSEDGLTRKLKDLLALQLASSTNRINTKHPIHDIYVKFADDSIYKLYSMVGARDQYNGDLEDFHGTLRLVRINVV